jgi:phosphoenolpyruvate carboxykinase (ATP)
MSHYGLENHGIVGAGKVHWNLPVAPLVEEAIRRGEGRLTSSGALNALTGKRTGRSPRDKWTVEEPSTKDKIWWGKVNQPISEQNYLGLRQEVFAYLQGRELFVMDGFAGADPRYSMPIRIVTEFAWHNLFVKQLFRRATPEQLQSHVPEWTVINACRFAADPKKHRLNSETFIVVDFSRKVVLIGGTQYAGEMKKSIFSVLNYVLPQQGVLPMHCSANVGKDGDVAIFFGLSGTGKTTLSADPNRGLIGDDEHGWSDHGVFNFEGGCYAKCIKLTKEREPLIWDAIRFGSVIENVVVDPLTGEPNYMDDSLTENTRCAYPLDYIANAVPSGMGGHPKAIIFLACDAFGVMPPVARLTPDQAIPRRSRARNPTWAKTRRQLSQRASARRSCRCRRRRTPSCSRRKCANTTSIAICSIRAGSAMRLVRPRASRFRSIATMSRKSSTAHSTRLSSRKTRRSVSKCQRPCREYRRNYWRRGTARRTRPTTIVARRIWRANS